MLSVSPSFAIAGVGELFIESRFSTVRLIDFKKNSGLFDFGPSSRTPLIRFQFAPQL